MWPQGSCATAKIRDWANANGHEVSSRGRISQAVRDAYDAAH
ncbi:Lsr2 family DNA-binding protein [Curtobacterium sp. UNCCL17]